MRKFFWSLSQGIHIRSDLIEAYRHGQKDRPPQVLVKEVWHAVGVHDLPEDGLPTVIAVVPARAEDKTRVLTWWINEGVVETCEHIPVAWRIYEERGTYSAPVPVWTNMFEQGGLDGNEWALLLEDGKVADNADAQYDNIEAWKHDLLERDAAKKAKVA